MSKKPIFAIDTNVFIHAANCKGMRTKPDETKVAKSVIATLIATCHPFLFSTETLSELKKKFKELKNNQVFMDYNIIKEIHHNVLYVTDEEGEAKYHFAQLNQKKDEVEELIPHGKDRKFIYLMRDFNYLGFKILITSDDSDFIPKDTEKKKQLDRYSKKYNFHICTPREVVKILTSQIDSIFQKNFKDKKELRESDLSSKKRLETA
ncbi:MAG: hypothetical protein ACXADY_04040 [Candidatus Hodarchaeales archaeon]